MHSLWGAGQGGVQLTVEAILLESGADEPPADAQPEDKGQHHRQRADVRGDQQLRQLSGSTLKVVLAIGSERKTIVNWYSLISLSL